MNTQRRFFLVLFLVFLLAAYQEILAQKKGVKNHPYASNKALSEPSLFLEGLVSTNGDRAFDFLPDINNSDPGCHGSDEARERNPARGRQEQQQKDVFILDIFENSASVKAIMSGWIDYMHMAKWNGEWKIVNVLWEYKPKK